MPLVWLVPLALPLAGLGLLLVAPSLDVRWEHHPSHFWLVLLVALVNLGLGVVVGDAARRRADARLVLVSLAFMAGAGFLALHALATPKILLDAPNAGFVVATPVGLLVASALAALSSLDLSPRVAAAIVARQRALGLALLALLGAWAIVSVAELPPLHDPISDERADGLLAGLAAAGLALYGVAAWRYVDLYRNRRSPVVLALVAAFALLAEAMIAVALGRAWRATWWEWHLLMAVAFGLVAWSARAEYRRLGSAAAAFSGLLLERTVEQVDRRSASGLTTLVDAMARGRDVGPVVEELRRRERFSAEEGELLVRAAREIRIVDDLFRPYLAPQVAERLRSNPELAELGGIERDVSVLFADLQGFTSFCERRHPAEAVTMLNRYWAEAVPVTLEHGGVIERFAGDAIMVVFNVGGDDPDHALRALAAGLGLQRAAEKIAEGSDWPHFRVGINTGPALLGNVGSFEQRSFAAIGDTTNLAARLQTLAEPGEVVLGGTTRAAAGEAARVRSLGPVELKGKREPVEAYVLLGLDLPALVSEPTSEKGA